LSRQLAAAGSAGPVHAILIVAGEATGPAVIAAASAATGQVPADVRYLPRAGAVILTAPANYLRALLDDHRVTVASATTIDIFPW
jgi:hypothetical protein